MTKAKKRFRKYRWLLTKIEQVKLFSIEIKWSLETNISQKANATVLADFDLSFLVLLGFTNRGDEFIRLHEVFFTTIVEI